MAAFSTIEKAVSVQTQIFLFLLLFTLSLLCASTTIAANSENLDPSPFPSNFLFGTASSAYQYEGAYLSDGKGLSNWDVFSHKPGNIDDGSNGDVAVDQYHRYLEDIDLMEDLGVNSYRFSISWARILPKGRFGKVNVAGINYYNRLIDALLLKGIQPFVTLSHFDLPQELEDRYGGWLSSKSQEDFQIFADICFKSFGDRVKYWITFNEPNLEIPFSYRTGIYPPSRCSPPFGNCTEGDSEREPFLAAHNIILSHAAAVDIYRTKYQSKQGGKIGIVLHIDWFEPFSNSTADQLATERAQAFTINWILDPVMFGKYPREMEMILGPILPRFSRIEKEKLKKGVDFIGVNHYSSYYVQDCSSPECIDQPGTSRTEGLYRETAERNGVPIGELTPFEWLVVYPQGMKKTVTYLKDRYNNTPIYITENGYGYSCDSNAWVEEYRNDTTRINYLAGHLENLAAAIREGVDVRGYFAWSLLDNFEWKYGQSVRFGLYHIDYDTLRRTPRSSATWYKNFIATHKTQNIMPGYDDNHNDKEFQSNIKLIRPRMNLEPSV